MPEENKKNWPNILLSFVLLVLAIGVIAVVNMITAPKSVLIPVEQPDNQSNSTSTVDGLNIGDNNETVSDDIKKFNSYKKLSIYSNGFITPSDYTENATTSLSKAAQKIKVTGDIEDAYVYIKAGANDENGNFTSIIKRYDGIWFYIENGMFLGGQLNPAKSVFGQTSNLTELLYNLKSVPVAKNLSMYRLDKYENIDFLKDLKDDRRTGSMVSTKRYGKIEKMVIAYKCKTNDDCKIELR